MFSFLNFINLYIYINLLYIIYVDYCTFYVSFYYSFTEHIDLY